MTRSVDPLFDPRLADWLEEDESTAPEQALEIVLASFPSIKQRRAVRVPWRNTRMSSTLRLGLAAAVVVAAALGGVYFLGSRSNPSVAAPESPSPTSTSQAGSPNLTTFTSPQYRYTIKYPSPYSAVAATEAWDGQGQLGPEEPWADRFFAPNSTVFVLIASLPKPPDVTEEEFASSYQQQVAEREPCAVPLGAWKDATVAGVPAQRADFQCGDTTGAEIIWITDGRGYAISGDAPVVDVMVATFTQN